MIPFIGNVQERQVQGQSVGQWLPGLGEGLQDLTARGQGLVLSDGNVLKSDSDAACTTGSTTRH